MLMFGETIESRLGDRLHVKYWMEKPHPWPIHKERTNHVYGCCGDITVGVGRGDATMPMFLGSGRREAVSGVRRSIGSLHARRRQCGGCVPACAENCSTDMLSETSPSFMQNPWPARQALQCCQWIIFSKSV